MTKKSLFLSAVSTLLLACMAAAPALADNTAPPPPPPAQVVNPGDAVKAAELACMGAAVDKRETAIQTALDTYYNMVKAALSTRHSGLTAGWALTDKTARQAAIKAAWGAFRGTWKKGSRQLNQDRRAAWKQFRMDKKSCGEAAKDENTDGEN